jgi:hypothetical protein
MAIDYSGDCQHTQTQIVAQYLGVTSRRIVYIMTDAKLSIYSGPGIMHER